MSAFKVFLQTKPSPASQGHEFDVRGYSRVLSILTHGLRLTPWHIAGLSSACYYLIPLVAAACTGVLVSPATARAQLAPLGLTRLGTFLSRGTNINIYYLTDSVHLLMTLMVLGGSGLLFYALANLEPNVLELLRQGKLSVDRNMAVSEFALARRHYRSLIWRAIVLVVSLSLGIVIERKTHDPTLSMWWGHASHGVAGHLFAAAVGAMVFFGGSWLFLLSSGLQALSRLLVHPVRLEPFHPDGCNGFAKFGDYLISLFFLSVMIAATAWLGLWKGYLGVEQLAITWIAGASGVFVIPVILIAPLIRCTRRISAARLERLCLVQGVFEQELTRIEADAVQAVDAGALGERVRRLRDTQVAAALLYPSNVFPFKPKVAGTLSATYILQVVLFAREAYAKLFS